MFSSAYALEFDNLKFTTNPEVGEKVFIGAEEIDYNPLWEKYPVLEVKNAFGLGETLFSGAIDKHTDQCALGCESRLYVSISEPKALIEDIRFYVIDEGKERKRDFNSYSIEYKVGEVAKEVIDYTPVCVYDNANQTTTCPVTETKRIIYEPVWAYYTVGEVMPSGDYLLKINGNKRPNSILDWQIKTSGEWLTDWAVWGLGTIHLENYSGWNSEGTNSLISDKQGMMINVSQDSLLINVTKLPSSNINTIYLLTENATQIANATISGSLATFSSPPRLSAGVNYLVVGDSLGIIYTHQQYQWGYSYFPAKDNILTWIKAYNPVYGNGTISSNEILDITVQQGGSTVTLSSPANGTTVTPSTIQFFANVSVGLGYANITNVTLWHNASGTFTRNQTVIIQSSGTRDYLWVPKFDTSSTCTESQLSEGAGFSGTANWTYNVLVTDEFSQVMLGIARSDNESRFLAGINTLNNLTSRQYAPLPVWKVIRNGNYINTTFISNNDTASDGEARIIKALVIASNNSKFSQSTRDTARTLASSYCKAYVSYDFFYNNTGFTSKVSNNLIKWFAGTGAVSVNSGMTSGSFMFAGYTGDNVEALIACANIDSGLVTFNQTSARYMDIARNVTQGYIEATDWRGSQLKFIGKTYTWRNATGGTNLIAGQNLNATCDQDCNPSDYDDASRVTSICRSIYFANLTLGGTQTYPLGQNISDYCNQWRSNSTYVNGYTNVSYKVQFYQNGSASGTLQEGLFENGLGGNLDFWPQSTSPNNLSARISKMNEKFDVGNENTYGTSCFGVYRMSQGVNLYGDAIGLSNPAFGGNSSSWRLSPATTGFSSNNLTVNYYTLVNWWFNDSNANQNITNFISESVAGGSPSYNVSFNVTLDEGQYKWNVQACDLDTDCGFGASNYTLFVDDTAPSVNIIYPKGQIPFGWLGQNTSLNYSIIDATIDTCQRTYNSTTTGISCTANSSFIMDMPRSITVFANDTLNNVGTNTSYFNFTVFENSNTYNMNSTTLSTENFLINVTWDTEAYDSISGSLVYDGTSYSATQSGSSNVIFSKSLLMPSVGGSTQNKIFNWSFFLSNETGTSTVTSRSFSQSVGNFSLDNCSVYTNVIINYTMFDEDNRTKIFSPGINNTAEITFKISDLTQTYSLNISHASINQNGTKICSQNPINGTYRMDTDLTYESDNHWLEFHYIRNYTLNSTTTNHNVLLYDLLTANGQEFQITVTDKNGIEIPDAVISIERQYLDINQYLEVEAPKTDTDGIAYAHLVLSDVVYNFKVYKEGLLLFQYNGYRASCENIAIGLCRIELKEPKSSSGFNPRQSYSGISLTSSWNNNTRLYQLSYSVINSSATNITINVTKATGLISNACYNSQLSVSGVLSCNLYSQPTGRYLIQVYNGGVLIASEWVNVQFGGATNKIKYLFAFLMIMSLPFLAITSAPVAMLLFIFGLIMASITGLLASDDLFGSFSAIFWLIIAGLILIWRAFSKKDRT
jgi:hypothetical protein